VSLRYALSFLLLSLERISLSTLVALSRVRAQCWQEEHIAQRLVFSPACLPAAWAYSRSRCFRVGTCALCSDRDLHTPTGHRVCGLPCLQPKALSGDSLVCYGVQSDAEADALLSSAGDWRLPQPPLRPCLLPTVMVLATMLGTPPRMQVLSLLFYVEFAKSRHVGFCGSICPRPHIGFASYPNLV